MADEEITRQAAHVLLDALSVFDDLSNTDPDRSIAVALEQLGEIGAIRLLVDDDTGDRWIDPRPLVKATLGLLTAAVTQWVDMDKRLDGMGAIEILRGGTDLAADK